MGMLDWLYPSTPAPPPPPPRPQAQANLQQGGAQLRGAQTDAQRCLNQHPTTANGTLPCGAPATKPPCDIKSFKVVEMRTVPNYTSSRVGGGASTRSASEGDDDAKRPYPKTWEFDPKGTIRGPKYISGSVIEVVGQDKKVGGRTQVTVTFEEAYKCPEHSKMIIVDPTGAKTEHKGMLSKSFEMEYPSLLQGLLKGYQDFKAGGGVDGVKAHGIDDIWLWGYKPKTWEITADVCSVRKSKEPVFSRTTAKVHVWPSDQFEMKFHIPPKYKRSGSNTSQSWTRNGATVNTSTNTRNTTSTTGFLHGQSASDTRTTETKNAQRGNTRTQDRVTTSRDQAIVTSDGSLRVTESETTRGGRTIGLSEGSTMTTGSRFGTQTTRTQNTAITPTGSTDTDESTSTGLVYLVKCSGHVVKDTFTSLNTILAIIRAIQKGIEAVRAFFRAIQIVQYGVMTKMEFGFEFLSGDIGASWGWKEWSDHRCYFGYGISVEIMLFAASIDFSVGVGLKVGPAECSASIGVNGSAEFKLAGEAKRADPDHYLPAAASIKLTGTSKIQLYVKAIAGSENFASAKAAVTVTLTAEAAPKVDKSAFTLLCGAKIEKTIASLDCVVAWVIKFNRKREVFPEKVFFKDAPVRLA